MRSGRLRLGAERAPCIRITNAIQNPEIFLSEALITKRYTRFILRSYDTMMTSELNQDYDLQKPIASTSGLRQGLTSYGDTHFSLFLRKVFIKALGYSEDALSSHYRHYQHGVWLQSLPWERQSIAGGCQTRHPLEGRYSNRFPDHQLARGILTPDEHVSAKSDEYGYGGDDSRTACGCLYYDRRYVCVR